MAGSVRIDDRESEIGIRLPTGLNELRDEGLLADVRGEGAVWGIGVPEGVGVVATRDALLATGVIIRPIPPHHLTLCPPLVTAHDQLTRLSRRLGRSCGLEIHQRNCRKNRIN
jgi:adenosylmethionine-8-amino-7-oxononanoate aminotransferase